MASGDVRAYQESHPWIDFRLDLRHPNPKFWLQLGECKALCDRLSRIPLPPNKAQELHTIYLAKSANATTAIEGNSLSEDQVKELISGQLTLPPSKEYLKTEVQNVLTCFTRVTELLETNQTSLTPDVIKSFNHMVLNGLELGEGVVPGKFRYHSVVVGNYRGAPAEDCDHLVGRLCDWVSGPDFKHSDPELSFALSIIKAIIAHVYFEWIHPFGDGNGRTGRMIELLLLLDAGFPTPAAHLLSNHYNQTKMKYGLELGKAAKTKNVLDFIQYAVQGLLDGLREQMEKVTEFQIGMTWEHFVFAWFKSEKSLTRARQRDVLLALAKYGPTVKEDIPLLSKSLRKEYLEKTHKTLTRDLNLLATEGLVKHQGEKWEACLEIILSLIPRSKRADEIVSETRRKAARRRVKKASRDPILD